MDIRAGFAPFSAEDDHLVRRLASAVLLQWKMIPTATQIRILEQAGLIEDGKSETVQLREQLNDFIRRYAASADV